MRKTIIKDEKGRDIIRISPKGRVAIARYPDMDEKTKDYIAGLYVRVTNRNKEKIVDFLNYVGEENEFCS